MDYNDVLATKYAAIHERSVPRKQPNLQHDTPEYCRAVWTIGNWEFTDAWKSMMTSLEALAPAGIIYKTIPTTPNDGQLHFTLMQTQTFSVIPTSLDTDPLLTDEANAIQTAMGRHPGFTITFRGVCRTQYGLFIKGYPSIDVNAIRDTIRVGIPDRKEPHAQDICHATLFRFTRDPTEEDKRNLAMVSYLFGDAPLATCTPTRWCYGFGTWTMTDRQALRTWPATPRWILHRGLAAGPDPAKENVPDTLQARMAAGWDVELDVWYKNGAFYLGHDAPNTQLTDDALLRAPRAWVHCKNLPAAKECLARGIPNFFLHDRDKAALTSGGWIWCYPGHSAGPRSVIVLPERTGFRLSDFAMLGVGAVCSDYLPETFY